MTKFPQRLHFVSGKGGVGKSVLSCALADAFARDGKRTLLCQINALDTHARLLDIPPPGKDLSRARDGLFTVNIDPEEALLEYAGMILKFDALVRTVFENRLTKTFLRFLPALQELNILGKIWYHAVELEGGKPKWDKIVVDAPSTGHAERLISVATVIHELSRGKGPLAEKSAAMKATLEDPSTSVMHVVTLPEEMPVNETLELIGRMRSAQTIQLGHLIMNQITPVLFPDGRSPISSKDTSPSSGTKSVLAAAAQRRAEREEIEMKQISRLEEKTDLRIVRVPKIMAANFNLQHTRLVAAALLSTSDEI